MALTISGPDRLTKVLEAPVPSPIVAVVVLLMSVTITLAPTPAELPNAALPIEPKSPSVVVAATFRLAAVSVPPI